MTKAGTVQFLIPMNQADTAQLVYKTSRSHGRYQWCLWGCLGTEGQYYYYYYYNYCYYYYYYSQPYPTLLYPTQHYYTTTYYYYYYYSLHYTTLPLSLIHI